MLQDGTFYKVHGRTGLDIPSYNRTWLEQYLDSYFRSMCDTHQSGISTFSIIIIIIIIIITTITIYYNFIYYGY
jgi:hypothetical protein